jgi:phosphoserine phosphatase
VSQVHAFFDFDDTLSSGDSLLFWLRYYYRKRPGRRIFLLANWAGLAIFALRLIDSHTLKRIFLMPMGLEDPEELNLLAAEFVREDLAARLHVPVLRRLWTHHLLGHKVVILSASAIFYLKHLKTFLPMADIQGSELIWPAKGPGIPEYKDGNLRGENKITRMKALGYGEAQPLSFAYSDHHHDRFLLRFSEFPICVRPTPKLRRMAGENGWPVLDWDEAGKRPRWKTLLGKFGMLLWPTGPGLSPTGSDPLKEAANAREYAPEHVRALRERVAMRYPDGKPEAVFKKIFGASAHDRA